MNLLREIREGQKISQKKLSEMSNVPQQTISAIESGERENPGIWTAMALSSALGKTVEEVFGKKDDRQAS